MLRSALAVFLVLAGCAESAETDGQPAEPVEIAASEETTAATSAPAGQELEGWTTRGEATWQVEDGVITPVEGSGRGFLVTEEVYDDFHATAEFWVDETANGGVFLRVPATGEIDQNNSFEVNIFDAHAEWPTGSINGLQRNDAPQTVGKWNTFEITAEGNHVVVSLNGEQVVDTEGERQASGPIALQYNGTGVIRYRNVEIQPL